VTETLGFLEGVPPGQVGGMSDPVHQGAATDRHRIDQPVGVDGDAAVRQRAHVGQDVTESGYGDGQPGLGRGLADDGVVGVLPVVDCAAGERPDAGGAGAARSAHEQHTTIVIGGDGVRGDPAEWFQCGGHGGILPVICYPQKTSVGFLTADSRCVIADQRGFHHTRRTERDNPYRQFQGWYPGLHRGFCDLSPATLHP